MNKITIHEPVWNGGNPYFSIRTDRVNDKHIFVVCDYSDKYGNLKYPHAFYCNGDTIRKTEKHKERWGIAYRLFLDTLENVYFYFTITWDGCDGMDDGSVTHLRYNYQDMMESIGEYLEQYKSRSAYLECCSMETSNGSHVVDLTNNARK